jgi:hypothetical protein
MTLRTELEAAGLNVKTVTGWGTRGGKWALGKPVAVMEHHTALPVPYPVSALYGDRLKANINTKPDGTVWLIAQGACNYSSGPGSSVVLSEARLGQPPAANARERGLVDDMGGNPYFLNFENDHAGDGGPIPKVQHDAIVTATRVGLNHYGLNSGNVISHAEWTARKRDPYWNGSLRAIETIRQQLEDVMTPAQEAKLDELKTLILKLPGATWKYPQGDDPAVPSSFQYQLRTYAEVLQLANHDDLDEAELAGLILAGLPAEAIAAAIPAGPLVDAVRDELNKRLDG